MAVRIGIVDDHPAVVLGVTGILNAESDLDVAATASTVAELLASNDTFDVVLLDLVLADGTTPTQNAETLIAQSIPVLAFTSGERPALVREVARAGAVGMIRKSEPPSVVVDAVRAVTSEQVVASPDWAAALDSDDGFVSAHLSSREAEVLALYASGETAERVGAQLYISRDTVLDHIRRVRAKYAAVERPASTKVALFRRAMEDGLVIESD